MSGQGELAWNVVAGRNRQRGNKGVRGKGGCFGARAKPVPRPATKRQRVSDGSAGSVTGAPPSSPALSLTDFKQLTVDDKLERIFVCLQGIMVTNERLLKAERVVNELHNTSQVNKDRINMLTYKSIDSEARQRRNNLLFWGIPENLSEDCVSTLNAFLTDRLHLDPDAIFIQRAHRLGKIRQRSHRAGQPKHRPIIAAFRDYPDAELILSNADKLRGTSCGINRDYPQEIVNARKPLFKDKKDLKLKYPNSNISVQFPAKLVKDGRVVRDEFPNWHTVLKRDRLDQQSYDMADPVRQGDRVFESSGGAQSNDSDTDVDLYDHVDDGPRPSYAGPMANGTMAGFSHGRQSSRSSAGNVSDHGGVSDTAGGTQNNNTDA